MADFAVITPALHEHARQVIGVEPFGDLATVSRSLTSLPGPMRTAAALEDLIARCTEALVTLSLRSQAIADSTLGSSRSYGAIEDSILHSLTTFPSG